MFLVVMSNPLISSIFFPWKPEGSKAPLLASLVLYLTLGCQRGAQRTGNADEERLWVSHGCSDLCSLERAWDCDSEMQEDRVSAESCCVGRNG